MAQPHLDAAAPREPAWDITFTRLTRVLQPGVAAFALGLARRFQSLGVSSDIDVRQTPRGLSTFLALVGERGLICIVDLTLVDGMVLGQGPVAWLDIRLLDGCGDVVAEGLGNGFQELGSLEPDDAQARVAGHLDRAGTAVYLATLTHFDLLRPVARHA